MTTRLHDVGEVFSGLDGASTDGAEFVLIERQRMAFWGCFLRVGVMHCRIRHRSYTQGTIMAAQRGLVLNNSD